MPRRYGADGTRLWNGKTPEEFTEADAYRFMVETEAVLQRKELMDDPAQPAPASGKEEFYLSKKDDVLLTPEQIAAEERRWLFDAPIAELAEVKGVSNVTIPFVDRFPRGEIYDLLTTRPEDMKNETKNE